MTAPRRSRTNAAPIINPHKLWDDVFIMQGAIARLPHRTLRAEGKLCYGRLCRYAGKRGLAYPKAKTLAGELGLSVRSIERALHQLRRVGLISSVHQGGRTRKGKGRPALIRFHWPADILGEIHRPAVLVPPPGAGPNGLVPPRGAGPNPRAVIDARAGVEVRHTPEVQRSAHGHNPGYHPGKAKKNKQRIDALVGGLMGGRVTSTRR